MPLPLNPAALAYVSKCSDYIPGQPLILDVFGTYCGPCRATLPHLAQMASRYPGAYFVAVSFEDMSAVFTFLGQMPQIRAMNVACDNGSANLLCNIYGVRGVPHCFVFDREGSLEWHGNPGEAECAQAIAKVCS